MCACACVWKKTTWNRLRKMAWAVSPTPSLALGAGVPEGPEPQELMGKPLLCGRRRASIISNSWGRTHEGGGQVTRGLRWHVRVPPALPASRASFPLHSAEDETARATPPGRPPSLSHQCPSTAIVVGAEPLATSPPPVFKPHLLAHSQLLRALTTQASQAF